MAVAGIKISYAVQTAPESLPFPPENALHNAFLILPLPHNNLLKCTKHLKNKQLL